MRIVSLQPHPDTEAATVTRVEVEVSRPRPGTLSLRYVLSGEISRLSLAPPCGESARGDDLWRHTCLEVFVAAAEGDGYHEFNFAPSHRWAAYSFDGYRRGMEDTEGMVTPRLETQARPDRYALGAVLDLRALPGLSGASAWRLALSAILEQANGVKSYWAMAHPPGKPDFHHPDSFALDLPAPEPA